MAQFIARAQHGCALRQQRGGNQRTLKPSTQGIDDGFFSRPFDAAVVAEVMTVPVTVVFTIGLVMTVVVADQIEQRETIMRHHIVDRFGWCTLTWLVQVGRAAQPLIDDALAAIFAR